MSAPGARRWCGRSPTGAGILAGWLAVHVLAVGHAVGAGTDGRSGWMLVLLALLTAPIVFALTARLLPTAPRRQALASR